jgi:flagellar hook assembly protein FlgD
LAIYDTSGRLARVLADRWMTPGEYAFEWDGRDNQGRNVASGVYYCRLTAGALSTAKTIVFLK